MASPVKTPQSALASNKDKASGAHHTHTRDTASKRIKETLAVDSNTVVVPKIGAEGPSAPPCPRPRIARLSLCSPLVSRRCISVSYSNT